MPNLVALIQAQGSTSLLSLRFVDVLIILLYFLMILGIGFYLKRFTTTGNDFFLAGRQMLRAHRGAPGKWRMLILGGAYSDRSFPRKEGL